MKWTAEWCNNTHAKITHVTARPILGTLPAHFQSVSIAMYITSPCKSTIEKNIIPSSTHNSRWKILKFFIDINVQQCCRKKRLLPSTLLFLLTPTQYNVFAPFNYLYAEDYSPNIHFSLRVCIRMYAQLLDVTND